MRTCELNLVQKQQRLPGKLLKRLNLAIPKAYRQQKILGIRIINEDLKLQVDAGIAGGKFPSPSEAQIPEVAAYYEEVRTYAVGLYGALRENLEIPSCKCPTAHKVGLQLEV
jgi:hypothetical protein